MARTYPLYPDLITDYKFEHQLVTPYTVIPVISDVITANNVLGLFCERQTVWEIFEYSLIVIAFEDPYLRTRLVVNFFGKICTYKFKYLVSFALTEEEGILELQVSLTPVEDGPLGEN